MANRLPAALAASIGGLCCALAGCSSRTDVSLTGNTPAQYSHVWLTTQEVWFNTSAIAGPDDSGWVKFPLSTPTTVDLAVQNGSSLGSVVTGLRLAAGTYSQVRLIPVDPTAALTSSAQTAGALYNAEADYVDTQGTTHQLRLELPNPEKGIGIAGSLKVPVGNVGAAVAASTATSTTTMTGGATTTTPVTTTTTPTTTTTATTPSTARAVPPTEFAISFDGERDLLPFSYPNTAPSGSSTATSSTTTPGVMLSSHAAAYDLSQVGAIQGTLTLTNLTSSVSCPLALRVSAQVLSADATRHVVVSSTPVHSDGTFMLYPLAANSSSATDYDVVIDGPGIATIIIKSVQVTLTTTTTPAATTQTTTAATTTTPGTRRTPVSVGTLSPRAASSCFSANVAPAPSGAPPAGATISFYQTLAAAGEVPYVIESSPIDPFNQVLANPQQLSVGTVDSGTWSASSSSVTLVSAAPAQGVGHYIVAASAPSFTDGALTAKAPAPTSGTATVIVPIPGLVLAPGTSSGSILATVTQATAGKYDQGELLVTHNGTLVASASLHSALMAGSGTVTLPGVPAGISAALYYVAIRAWSSHDPSVPLQRQSYPAVVDLRSGTSGTIQLTVN